MNTATQTSPFPVPVLFAALTASLLGALLMHHSQAFVVKAWSSYAATSCTEGGESGSLVCDDGYVYASSANAVPSDYVRHHPEVERQARLAEIERLASLIEINSH